MLSLQVKVCIDGVNQSNQYAQMCIWLKANVLLLCVMVCVMYSSVCHCACESCNADRSRLQLMAKGGYARVKRGSGGRPYD